MSIKQHNMIKQVFKTPLFDHIQETIFWNYLGLGPSIEQFLLSVYLYPFPGDGTCIKHASHGTP